MTKKYLVGIVLFSVFAGIQTDLVSAQTVTIPNGAELCEKDICVGNIVTTTQGVLIGRLGRVERIITSVTPHLVEEHDLYGTRQPYQVDPVSLLTLAAPMQGCFGGYCVGDLVERTHVGLSTTEKYGFVVYLPPLMQQGSVAVQVYNEGDPGAPLIAESIWSVKLLRPALGSR